MMGLMDIPLDTPFRRAKFADLRLQDWPTETAMKAILLEEWGSNSNLPPMDLMMAGLVPVSKERVESIEMVMEAKTMFSNRLGRVYEHQRWLVFSAGSHFTVSVHKEMPGEQEVHISRHNIKNLIDLPF